MNVPDPFLETINCPLCNHPEANFIFDFSPYQLKQCKQCQLYYLSPRLNEAAMQAYYAQPDYFEGGMSGYDNYLHQEQTLRATFRRFLKRLHHKQYTGGDLLEIGCAYGFLLDEAKPYFQKRVGLDFSETSVQKATQYADAVYCGGVESLPDHLQFDMIIALQVIEHVYDPILFMKRLISLLKPGGRIALATPDIGSFWFKTQKEQWSSFKLPEHVLFFNQHSLSTLFQQAGLIHLKTIPYPHAFPLSLVASKLGVVLPGFIQQIPVWLPSTTVAMIGQKNESPEC